MGEVKEIIEHSIQKLEKWLENHEFRGYDPFDGLSSFLRPLTLGNLFLERLLEQTIRQSPINLRPLLGVKPQISTKGIGFIAWGYLHMFERTGDVVYKEKAFLWLDWLDKNRAPGYENHSWANHFDHSSRSGRQPKDEPDIVWTGLIGQAYLEAYWLFKEVRHRDIIRSISKWILDLPRERSSNGICLSYGAGKQSSIHNSNMVGAAFLARAAQTTGDSNARNVARDAMQYSCSRQLPDGSWFYGEEGNKHWIDNFHTAYNLDSLRRYIDHTGDQSFEMNLRRGMSFYKNHFFEEGGRPRYYHDRTYPVDSQCAAQAIDTFAYFSDYDPECSDLACKVATWTIENMQDEDGHFYFRQYPLGIKAKAPMLHWAQTTTYKALANLLMVLTKA
jgi:hypothetical protein